MTHWKYSLIASTSAVALLATAGGCSPRLIGSFPGGSVAINGGGVTYSSTPTISTISTQLTQPGVSTGAIAFTVSDTLAPLTALTLSAASSNSTVIPSAQVTFGGSGGSRTVTIAPASGQSGPSTVTLTVSNGTHSASTSFVVYVGTNLEVPIELLDGRAIGSDLGVAGDQYRTTMPLDSRDYDGTTTYFFEVVAENTDSATRSVTLKDTPGGNIYATASIPNGAGVKRVRVPFSAALPAASVNLIIQTAGTTADYQLNISEARVLIQQVGATKTKLYIPLLVGPSILSASFGAYNGAPGGSAYDGTIDSNVTTAAYNAAGNQPWGSTAMYPIWLKDSSVYNQLAGANPWTFQVMMFADTASTGHTVLYDRTSSSVVADAVSTTPGTTEIIAVPLADSALVDGHLFDVRARNTVGGAKHTVAHKAGIWVTLQNLTRGEVFYRTGRGFQFQAPNAASPDRVALDFTSTSPFTLPKVHHEATASCSPTPCSYWLIDDGGVTAGLGPGSVVAGTFVNPPGNATQSTAFGLRTRVRSADLLSAGALSRSQANNYLIGYDPGVGYINFEGSFLVVGFGQ